MPNNIFLDLLERLGIIERPLLSPQRRSDLISPLASPRPTPRPTPTPMPSPSPEILQFIARNPEVARTINLQNVQAPLRAIREAAQRTRIPEELLQDIAWQESKFDPRLRNPAGTATGLFQFTTPTWQDVMRYYPDIVAMRQRTDPYLNALAAAREIAARRLWRWEASKPVWGGFYSPEEISRYYPRSR